MIHLRFAAYFGDWRIYRAPGAEPGELLAACPSHAAAVAAIRLLSGGAR